jgi:hypothetical protein
MTAAMTFDDVLALTGGRLGVFDVACRFCAAFHNPRRKVLRIWAETESFAGFACARCGEKGWVGDRKAARPSRTQLDHIRHEAAARAATELAERQRKAAYLWSLREPIAATSPPSRYLRETRCYRGPIPQTLAYLRPQKPQYHHAMIAAFAMVDEPEPGVVGVPKSVAAVHLTLLKPDGGKADIEAPKIVVGKGVRGVPITLAPPNDLLGLVIAEGIEDALSVHAATGLGAWAGGCANRLPALAAVVPSYIDYVSILVDDNDAGCRHAGALLAALERRGVSCIGQALGAASS